MEERARSRRRYRIGELAEATGLTVRTLHHYEHIGLLAPSARTEGRQRLYDEHDVRRLYRIRALRDLGLSLADIGRMLDDDRDGLADLLRAHRARVAAEIEGLERLRSLLDHACAHADRDVAPEDVLATIEAMSRVVRRSEARRKKGNAAKDAEARWREIGEELRACMKDGEPPSAPRPRAVAQRALARIVEFAGGDRATLEALAHLRRLDPPKSFAGWSPALMRYLDQALSNLQRTEREP
ncbi:Regulatory protein, MerR [Minicystis rosea]|nr:Regulatory protein, MerR [Minicystis rosea]